MTTFIVFYFFCKSEWLYINHPSKKKSTFLTILTAVTFRWPVKCCIFSQTIIDTFWILGNFCEQILFLWPAFLLVVLIYNAWRVATILVFETSLLEVSKSRIFQSTSTTNTKMACYLYDTKRYLKLFARFLCFCIHFQVKTGNLNVM